MRKKIKASPSYNSRTLGKGATRIFDNEAELRRIRTSTKSRYNSTEAEQHLPLNPLREIDRNASSTMHPRTQGLSTLLLVSGGQARQPARESWLPSLWSRQPYLGQTTSHTYLFRSCTHLGPPIDLYVDHTVSFQRSQAIVPQGKASLSFRARAPICRSRCTNNHARQYFFTHPFLVRVPLDTRQHHCW